MSLPSRLLGANPSIQVSALLSGSLSTPSAKGAFVPVIESYESIATVTVGAGGQANIEFTSIPATYKHLQIRCYAQVVRSTYGIGDGLMQFNSDTASNYSWHNIRGIGSSTNAEKTPTSTYITIADGMWGTSTGTTFGVSIVDILDYTNTSIYKTTRAISGVDFNGTLGGYGGFIGLNSGNWRNTSAITSIKLTSPNGNFTQYSSFALYGIEGV
jgi:hypothetical protein